MKNSYVDIWNNLHKSFIENKSFKSDNWLDEFRTIIDGVNTDIIDLGCGVTGNNTIYLSEMDKNVIACDFSEIAIKEVAKNKKVKTFLFNMLDTFPFDDSSIELIIADLSLHYFRSEDTIKIIQEIKRVLKHNGYLFFRVNSTNSTEFKSLLNNNSEEIERNLYFNNNMEKRFFSDDDLETFFKGFEFVYKREENMTRWSDDKIVWKCVVKNKKGLDL